MNLTALESIASYFSVETPWVRTLTLALVVLIVGYLAASILSRLARLLMQELSEDNPARRMVTFTISAAIAAIGYAATLFVVFYLLGILRIIIYIFAGVILLGILVSIIKLLMESIPNLLGARKIRGLRADGTIYQLAGIRGKIVRKGLMETCIETAGNECLFVPNAAFLKTMPKKAQ